MFHYNLLSYYCTINTSAAEMKQKFYRLLVTYCLKNPQNPQNKTKKTKKPKRMYADKY